ncbi:MAG: RnfABCDGE type electron transport complex subunit D [Sarcina sp.]
MNKQNVTQCKTTKINKQMLDVVIALMPSLIAGIYFYKSDALKIVILSVVSCVFFEWIWNLLLKRRQTIYDLSAIVTGLLLAFILPVHVPVWVPIMGGAFAIILVKQVFGGLNNNFMNPAVATKAFLIASWAGVISGPIVTGASETVSKVPLIDIFIGQPTGNIGETSVLAILIGGIYLLIRKVINGATSISFIITFIISNYIISIEGWFKGSGLEAIISGSVMLTAIFLINDKSTTPKDTLGQIIFGCLTAILATIFIPFFPGNPLNLD